MSGERRGQPAGGRKSQPTEIMNDQLKQPTPAGRSAPICSRCAELELERDQWKANHDNQVELKRIIAARPDLKERAPMVEKLLAERNRAQAHSIRQHALIKQLQSGTTKEMLAALLQRVKSGEEAPEDVAEYRHLAGEISAWGAKFAEAMRRRDERAARKSSEKRLSPCTPT